MEMGILQTLGLLASIAISALGIIKWLLTRMDTGDESIKLDLLSRVAANTIKIDAAVAAISSVRETYANKQELAAVVQMFQQSLDRQSAETSRAVDGITSRIDNLINIVTKQHNGH